MSPKKIAFARSMIGGCLTTFIIRTQVPCEHQAQCSDHLGSVEANLGSSTVPEQLEYM
jgi:hypothetical protein